MKKIGIISLALVLALGSLGIAYAHWSDQLFIEGTVHGGELMVGFTEVFCEEMHGDPPVPGEYLDKDVGDCDVEYVDYRVCSHTGKDGYGGAIVTITDAYPCYEVHVTFVVDNLGTIPVIFEGVTISDPTGELTYDPGEECLYEDANGNGVKDADEPCIINFDFVNLIGVQLEYCEDTKAEVDLHFKQEAEECHTYSFRVDLDAIQYNKSIYWPP
jgi:hypothetical protein